MLRPLVVINLFICAFLFSYNVSAQLVPTAFWNYSANDIAGNAPLLGSVGMTKIVSVDADDANIAVALPFSITVNGTAYTSWYVGSNTYITGGAGSIAYSALGPNNPPLPSFHLGSDDNSYQQVFSLTGKNFVRVRYEGTAATTGTVGSPNIVYEVTFYRPSNGVQYVQVVFGVHARSTGNFGVTKGSGGLWYASATPITINSSYVFKGDSTGSTWTLLPNRMVTGSGVLF